MSTIHRPWKRHQAEGRQSIYPIEPLYDTDDVEAACQSLVGMPFNVAREITPGVIATLLPSGHILGASMVLIEAKTSGKTLLFSGDLGRPGRPLLPEPAWPPRADFVVMESTYGDRIHSDVVTVADQLCNVINNTLGRRGSVLIPCFAVERAQELLHHLQTLRKANRIPKVPIFLDSPMAVRLLKVFGHHRPGLPWLGRREPGQRTHHRPVTPPKGVGLLLEVAGRQRARSTRIHSTSTRMPYSGTTTWHENRAVTSWAKVAVT